MDLNLPGIPDSININMMGWQPDGSDDGGQYYYDLTQNINPINTRHYSCRRC